MERYRKEMEEYQSKLARRCRLEREHAASHPEDEIPCAGVAAAATGATAEHHAMHPFFAGSQQANNPQNQQQATIPQNIYVQAEPAGQQQQEDVLDQLRALLAGTQAPAFPQAFPQQLQQQAAGLPIQAPVAPVASTSAGLSNIDLSSFQHQVQSGYTHDLSSLLGQPPVQQPEPQLQFLNPAGVGGGVAPDQAALLQQQLLLLQAATALNVGNVGNVNSHLQQQQQQDQQERGGMPGRFDGSALDEGSSNAKW